MAKIKFPTEEEFVKNAAEKALDEILYDGKSIREWIKIIAKQEPETGRWIGDEIQGEIDGQIVKAFICSKCGAISVFRITDGKIVNGDLCPNCGARMSEVEE